jgi:hypothetical protein
MCSFLFHDDTARKSPVGEKESSEMPSSGGSVKGASFEVSPCVLLGAEAAAFAPKRFDDMVGGEDDANKEKSERVKFLNGLHELVGSRDPPLHRMVF